MLNFQRLISQIKNVGWSDLLEEEHKHEIIQAACLAYQNAGNNALRYAEKLQENAGHTFWRLSQPLEDISIAAPLQPLTTAHTVVSADGSQIVPTQHEIYTCYLLNIGVCVITYGLEKPVLLESLPYLFHKTEDLYPLLHGRRNLVDDSFIAAERFLLELENIFRHAYEAKKYDVPVIAMFDGPLIPYALNNSSDEYQKVYFEHYASILQKFHDNEIPLIGYISRTKSFDIVNTLRVWTCPYERSFCSQLCGGLSEDETPCASIWPATDRQLVAANLSRDHRTAVYRSAASWTSHLPPAEHVCFTYLHTGEEIARVEFPEWLFARLELFQLSLNCSIAQIQKGKGYPVCLAEAHNLAVVHYADREHFFNLLAQHLITQGLEEVRLSAKEFSKRQSLI